MIPVDANLLMGILIVVTIVAYIFVLRGLKTKSISARVPKKDSDKQDPKGKEVKETPKELPETTPHEKSQSTCLHHFGYLRSLPKSSSLPDECLGCPKVVKCLTATRSGKSQNE